MIQLDASAGPDRAAAASRTAYSLNRASAVALYHQLFMDLRRRLLNGEWKPGDPFPKDSEIEETYGVSRITVRQAVSQLVDGNFVVRYRGAARSSATCPAKGRRLTIGRSRRRAPRAARSRLITSWNGIVRLF